MTQAPIKNKTLATWLAVLLGSMGVHRFYLRGLGDWIGWMHPIASALGWWGVERVQIYGQDDQLSWILIPFLGASIAAACLPAIYHLHLKKLPSLFNFSFWSPHCFFFRG